MSNNNKPQGEDVTKNDQPKPEEVVKTGVDSNSIVNDWVTPEPAPQSGTEETPEEKPEETPAEPDPETPEAKPEDTPAETPAEDGELFAKVGSREFKTKDDLIAFAKSQVGYSSWLTGSVKRIRPDLFNEDGSIKSTELEKAIANASTDAKTAAETLKELGTVPADELTDEQKEDMKKAKEILKPLGVVFKDDPEFIDMTDKIKHYEAKTIEEATGVVATFAEAHPLVKDYAEQLAEVMEKNPSYDLEKGWKVCKVMHDIDEPTDDAPITKKDDTVVKKPVDTTIPNVVKKESGSTPSSGKKDIWDEVLAIRNK